MDDFSNVDPDLAFMLGGELWVFIIILHNLCHIHPLDQETIWAIL